MLDEPRLIPRSIAAARDHAVADLGMSAKQGVVGEHAVVADLHIVARVRVGHPEVAVADAADAVAAYKRFLALGGTRPLPELYAAAGVTLVFDAETMAELVAFVEERIAALRAGADAPFRGVMPV